VQRVAIVTCCAEEVKVFAIETYGLGGHRR
jgi:hypothetical protein